METISSIQQLNLTNLLSLKVYDLSGECVTNYVPPFNTSSLYMRNLQVLNSVETLDLSGTKNVYGIDLSGAIHLSTLTGIENAYVIKLDDIDSSLQTLIQKELNNKNILMNLDYDLLKKNLYTWAANGYQDSFMAHKFILNDPTVTNGKYTCSDGVLRDIWKYMSFILGMSIQELVTSFQAKLKGIVVSYSVEINPITLNLHVSKA
jgi:hypothetical protein